MSKSVEKRIFCSAILRYQITMKWKLFQHDGNTYDLSHLHPFDLEYSDNRESRTFCFDRYRLSFHLPDIIRNIHTKQCNHSGKGNFFIVELVTDEDKPVEYFTLTSRNQYQKVPRCNCTYKATTCEPRTANPTVTRPKRLISIVIAHNRKVGKPIKTPG